MSKSIWRQHSRRVIAEVLHGLPAGASDNERRAALRKAYPFGERSNHPYRIWLREVRLALGIRGSVTPRESRIELDTSSGDLEIVVTCDWCFGNDCLGCLALRKRLENQRQTTDWRRWKNWLDWLGEDNDPVTRLAFADWLEEVGWPEEASRVRRGKTM